MAAAAAAAESCASAQVDSGRKITVVSSDEQSFDLPEAVALVSGSIRSQIETGFLHVDSKIKLTLDDVAATPLAMVVEYCHRKAADGEWDDREFIPGNVGQALLYDILHAAICLDVEGLVDLACKRAADMIRGKAPAEIRRLFGIDDDGFTPEQRDQIRKENSWIKM